MTATQVQAHGGRVVGLFVMAAGVLMTAVILRSEPLTLLEIASPGADVTLVLAFLLSAILPTVAGFALVVAPRGPVIGQWALLAATAAPLTFLTFPASGVWAGLATEDVTGSDRWDAQLLVAGFFSLVLAALAHLVWMLSSRRQLFAPSTGGVFWLLSLLLAALWAGGQLLVVAAVVEDFHGSVLWWLAFGSALIVCLAALAVAGRHPVAAARRHLAWGQAALVLLVTLGLLISGWFGMSVVLVALGLPLFSACLAGAAALTLGSSETGPLVPDVTPSTPTPAGVAPLFPVLATPGLDLERARIYRQRMVFGLPVLLVVWVGLAIAADAWDDLLVLEGAACLAIGGVAVSVAQDLSRMGLGDRGRVPRVQVWAGYGAAAVCGLCGAVALIVGEASEDQVYFALITGFVALFVANLVRISLLLRDLQGTGAPA